MEFVVSFAVVWMTVGIEFWRGEPVGQMPEEKRAMLWPLALAFIGRNAAEGSHAWPLEVVF